MGCARTTGQEGQQNNSIYLEGIRFRDAGRADSAFFYLNKARDIYQQERNNFGMAKCLVNMAIILTDKGDNFGGQELALKAIPLLDKNNTNHHSYLQSNFNNLGIASYNLKEYDQAIDFYQRALPYLKTDALRMVMTNNIANAYCKKKDFNKAISLYRTVLSREKQPVNYARTLANYAHAMWLKNNSYNPLPEFHKALSIRKREGDRWGENISYFYLSEYYTDRNRDSALTYAERMYNTAQELRSPDDRLAALGKIVSLTEGAREKRYFKRYQSLGDSIENVRAADKNQFAVIRFETEKHKADNLQLQKQNAVRNIWIVTLLLTLLSIGIFAYIWERKRNERLAFEKRQAIQETELKLSKKVHDIVANGLYRLMSAVENQPDISRQVIVDDIERLYEQSRDLSYQSARHGSEAFAEKISLLISSFASDELKVLIVGNKKEIWQGLDAGIREHIVAIVQELLVNMRKHSRADRVLIKFERTHAELSLLYSDNGIGLPENQKKGNGLKNTGTRIKELNATITFESLKNAGLKVRVSVPLA